MTEERGPRLERLLELTARKVSGGGLHPLEILQHVSEAAEASVRDGTVANDYVVSLHPADFARYQRSLPNLHAELDGMLDDLERTRRWTRIGERSIAFVSSESAAEGSPGVAARFSDTSHHVEAAPPGATRRITRHKNLVLAMTDGTRVRLTHTPFTIGRGPGNDLVVADLAVSRRHAEIVRTEAGIVMRDLGSRNGLTVDGERYPEVIMGPWMVVTIGDVGFWLEQAE
jgi:hypothetical protein